MKVEYACPQPRCSIFFTAREPRKQLLLCMTSPLADYIVFFFVFFFAKCPSRNQFCPTTMHGLHRTREREKKDATKKRNTAPKLYTLAKNVAIWGSLPQVTIFGNNSLRNLFRVYAVSQTNEAAVILLYVGQTDEIDRSNSVRKND